MQGSYYWAVLTPGAAISLGGSAYSGAAWAGVSDATGFLPATVTSDPCLFTGRQLTSERFRGDTTFACSSGAAASWIRGSSNWTALNWTAASTAARVTNWPALGSRVRYGLQVIGFPYSATPTQSPSGEKREGGVECGSTAL